MMKRFSCARAFGTKTGSGLPSQEVLDRNDLGTKAVRLREAGYRYEAQLRQLERQFDAKARELSAEFLSAVERTERRGMIRRSSKAPFRPQQAERQAA
jgi:hypothetical protein